MAIYQTKTHNNEKRLRVFIVEDQHFRVPIDTLVQCGFIDFLKDVEDFLYGDSTPTDGLQITLANNFEDAYLLLERELSRQEDVFDVFLLDIVLNQSEFTITMDNFQFYLEQFLDIVPDGKIIDYFDKQNLKKLSSSSNVTKLKELYNKYVFDIFQDFWLPGISLNMNDIRSTGGLFLWGYLSSRVNLSDKGIILYTGFGQTSPSEESLPVGRQFAPFFLRTVNSVPRILPKGESIFPESVTEEIGSIISDVVERKAKTIIAQDPEGDAKIKKICDKLDGGLQQEIVSILVNTSFGRYRAMDILLPHSVKIKRGEQIDECKQAIKKLLYSIDMDCTKALTELFKTNPMQIATHPLALIGPPCDVIDKLFQHLSEAKLKLSTYPIPDEVKRDIEGWFDCLGSNKQSMIQRMGKDLSPFYYKSDDCRQKYDSLRDNNIKFKYRLYWKELASTLNGMQIPNLKISHGFFNGSGEEEGSYIVCWEEKVKQGITGLIYAICDQAREDKWNDKEIIVRFPVEEPPDHTAVVIEDKGPGFRNFSVLVNGMVARSLNDLRTHCRIVIKSMTQDSATQEYIYQEYDFNKRQPMLVQSFIELTTAPMPRLGTSFELHFFAGEVV